MIDFSGAAPTTSDLDVPWIHGTAPGAANADPAVQVHACDAHTYVLRQSKAVSYEAPFIYLLFGNERAMLLDTGATKDSAIRTAVDGLLTDWLERNPRDEYGLVVAHTHGHSDHVAGDLSFADRPGTTVVAREPEAVREFFGFADWPGEVVTFDLGGRCPGGFGNSPPFPWVDVAIHLTDRRPERGWMWQSTSESGRGAAAGLAGWSGLRLILRW